MRWEKQFESMLSSGHLDDEALKDLTVAYAAETGDESIFGIDMLSLVSPPRKAPVSISNGGRSAFPPGFTNISIAENNGPYLFRVEGSVSVSSLASPPPNGEIGGWWCSVSSSSDGPRGCSWSNSVRLSLSGYNYDWFPFTKPGTDD